MDAVIEPLASDFSLSFSCGECSRSIIQFLDLLSKHSLISLQSAITGQGTRVAGWASAFGGILLRHIKTRYDISRNIIHEYPWYIMIWTTVTTTMLCYGPEGSFENTAVTCNSFNSSPSSEFQQRRQQHQAHYHETIWTPHHFVDAFFKVHIQVATRPKLDFPNFPLVVLVFVCGPGGEGEGRHQSLGAKTWEGRMCFSGRRNQGCPGVMARAGGRDWVILDHVWYVWSFDVFSLWLQTLTQAKLRHSKYWGGMSSRVQTFTKPMIC